MPELRTISKEELTKILAEHLLWLQGAEGGVRANLRYANLTSANLRYANLTSADLTSANLTSADLTSANLNTIKHDVVVNILKLPNEIPFLRQALVDGKIDGSTYTGECACLAGTMAHACNAKSIDEFRSMGVMPIDSASPRERWFLGILPGHTPENSKVAKLTLEWIDEALAMVARIRATAPVSGPVGEPAVETDVNPVPNVMPQLEGLRAD